MLRILFVGVLLCLVAAPSIADGPSYNYVQVGYGVVTIDSAWGPDYRSDVIGFGGSLETSESVFAFANYGEREFDWWDETILEAGAGWYADLSSSLDLFAAASYVRINSSSREYDYSSSHDGWRVVLGLRKVFNEHVEGATWVSFADFGGRRDATEFGAKVLVGITNRLSLGFGVGADDRDRSYNGTLRYYFGRK